jgi:hypothetical protein
VGCVWPCRWFDLLALGQLSTALKYLIQEGRHDASKHGHVLGWQSWPLPPAMMGACAFNVLPQLPLLPMASVAQVWLWPPCRFWIAWVVRRRYQHNAALLSCRSRQNRLSPSTRDAGTLFKVCIRHALRVALSAFQCLIFSMACCMPKKGSCLRSS